MFKKMIPFFIIVFSLSCAIITKDYFWGFSALLSGIFNAYYTSLGKKINYLYGAIFYLINSYISYEHHLYGIFILSLFLYLPFQLLGYFNWQKNELNNQVIKNFNRLSINLIISFSIVLTIILTIILNAFPYQQLPLLDAASNALNICSIILLVLRYEEALWLWLINNIFDLAIWSINFITEVPNSTMMFIISLIYLLINVYSIYHWRKKDNMVK